MSITSESHPPLHERVVALDEQLAPIERTVARFLSDHPDLVAGSTAVELAKRIGTSNATVIRTVKALGYSGLPALRRVQMQAMVDRHDPARVLTQHIERIDADVDSIGEPIAYRVLTGSTELMQQAHRLIDGDAWRRATQIIKEARSVLTYGIEQAGCVASYCAIELSRCGHPARAVTSTGIRIAGDLVNLSGDDAVIVFAPLRHFREIDLVIDHARSVGAPVILISEALGMSFENRVAVVLATPQSTLGNAGEIIVPMVLARALTLDMANQDRTKAIRTYEQINELRAAAVGGAVDVDLNISLPAAPPAEQ